MILPQNYVILQVLLLFTCTSKVIKRTSGSFSYQIVIWPKFHYPSNIYTIQNHKITINTEKYEILHIVIEPNLIRVNVEVIHSI